MDNALSGRLVVLDRMVLEHALDNLASLQLAAASAFAMLNTRLDEVDGDSDDEPGGDDEPAEANGDTLDAAHVEWTTLRGSQKRGPNILPTYNEDDEDGDADEDDDPPGQCSEDEISCGSVSWSRHGAGCELSDPGGCQHDGREPTEDGV